MPSAGSLWSDGELSAVRADVVRSRAVADICVARYSDVRSPLEMKVVTPTTSQEHRRPERSPSECHAQGAPARSRQAAVTSHAPDRSGHDPSTRSG